MGWTIGVLVEVTGECLGLIFKVLFLRYQAYLQPEQAFLPEINHELSRASWCQIICASHDLHGNGMEMLSAPSVIFFVFFLVTTDDIHTPHPFFA